LIAFATVSLQNLLDHTKTILVFNIIYIRSSCKLKVLFIKIFCFPIFLNQKDLPYEQYNCIYCIFILYLISQSHSYAAFVNKPTRNYNHYSFHYNQKGLAYGSAAGAIPGAGANVDGDGRS
jgi:hypothetical protein